MRTCRCHVDYDVDKLYFRPMSRCLGGRPAHAALMKYERDFLSSYAPLPRLSWSVYLEGHEPTFRAMSLLDADLAAHLLQLRATHGERLAILLLSDHGIHYGRCWRAPEDPWNRMQVLGTAPDGSAMLRTPLGPHASARHGA